jgi:hypothetical protein
MVIINATLRMEAVSIFVSKQKKALIAHAIMVTFLMQGLIQIALMTTSVIIIMEDVSTHV